MRRLAHNRAALFTTGAAALLVVAAGSALAAGLGGAKVTKGILTYDSDASATPTQTVVGTTLGDTWYASCALVSGATELDLAFATSDGSWTSQFSSLDYNDSGAPATTYVSSRVYPPGTFTNPLLFGSVTDSNGAGADRRLDVIQLGPSSGHLIIHLTARKFDSTCHLSIEVATDKIARKTGVVTARPVNPPQSGKAVTDR